MQMIYGKRLLRWMFGMHGKAVMDLQVGKYGNIGPACHQKILEAQATG